MTNLIEKLSEFGFNDWYNNRHRILATLRAAEAYKDAAELADEAAWMLMIHYEGGAFGVDDNDHSDRAKRIRDYVAKTHAQAEALVAYTAARDGQQEQGNG